jgi:hypothetical protein
LFTDSIPIFRRISFLLNTWPQKANGRFINLDSFEREFIFKFYKQYYCLWYVLSLLFKTQSWKQEISKSLYRRYIIQTTVKSFIGNLYSTLDLCLFLPFSTSFRLASGRDLGLRPFLTAPEGRHSNIDQQVPNRNIGKAMNLKSFIK